MLGLDLYVAGPTRGGARDGVSHRGAPHRAAPHREAPPAPPAPPAPLSPMPFLPAPQDAAPQDAAPQDAPQDAPQTTPQQPVYSSVPYDAGNPEAEALAEIDALEQGEDEADEVLGRRSMLGLDLYVAGGGPHPHGGHHGHHGGWAPTQAISYYPQQPVYLVDDRAFDVEDEDVVAAARAAAEAVLKAKAAKRAMLGTEVTVATSDIKWSDGKIVQLGTPVYDKTYGRGVISKLTPSDSGLPKPRVEVKWDSGGSYSWETSVLSADMRQLPVAKVAKKSDCVVCDAMQYQIVGPVRVWHALLGVAATAGGAMLWRLK